MNNNNEERSFTHKHKRNTISISSEPNGTKTSTSTGTNGNERLHATRDRASEPLATSNGSFWNDVNAEAEDIASLDPALEDVNDKQEMEVNNPNGATSGVSKYEDDQHDLTDSHEPSVDAPPLELQIGFINLEDTPRHAGRVQFYRCGSDNKLGRGNWMHTLNVTCTRKGKQIGSGRGIYVKRDVIRSNFWLKMQELRPDLSSIAFELFDRYGRLNEQFISHPVRKGKGCWGSEVNLGDLLIIEYVWVHKKFLLEGIGRAILNILLEKSRSGERNAAFSIARPGLLPPDVEEALRGKARRKSTREGYRFGDIIDATAFYRSCGFCRIGASRCLGLATDHRHRARSVLGHLDPNVPFPSPDIELTDTECGDGALGEETRGRIMRQLEDESKIRHAMLSRSDRYCVQLFKINYSQAELKHRFEWIDRFDNNLLHVAVVASKPKCIQWLLDNVDEGQRFSLGRNKEGFTPLELLMYRLEIKRNFQQQPNFAKRVVADSFSGYDDDAIHCLVVLHGIRALTSVQVSQFKYGCICGQCISGYLSPRMKLALSCQAKAAHDTLSSRIEETELWCRSHQDLIKHVAPEVQDLFHTNIEMRQSFSNIFDHAVAMLRSDTEPTVYWLTRKCRDFVLPFATTFLDRGGTIESVLRIIFERARDHDELAGNGEHVANLDNRMARAGLPTCRNDHEFGFVALACGVEKLNET
ncbi:hypothetical protein VTL71DRAFT_13314 [Oculimacula yallundae]|uniref:N-acetyltransferase domain-containing protein n=1 Tax=Oculimacula yallundae TaxID=86028 RepID=A0ABR4CK56_9HELO